MNKALLLIDVVAC